MKLKELTDTLNNAVISGDTHVEITGVATDSRKVEPGMVYVAVKGTKVDGADFIPQALEAGAVAVIAEKAPSSDWSSCVWVHVKDTREALALTAGEFEGHPSREFKLIGVTGTNGKTTTTYMMHHVLETVQLRAGMLGTIKVHNGLKQADTTHTTPDPVVLQGYLREMADNGCRSVAMEVSSHGIEQKRVTGIDFDVVAFTNLSQDHLDYHGNMETYFQAKRELFVNAVAADKKVKAVINLDDAYGAKLVQEFAEKMPIITIGMGVHCDFRFGNIRQSIRGSEFELKIKGKSYLVRIPMIGRFNIYNAVTAIACCVAVGVKPRDAVRSLVDMPAVSGRMELVETKMSVSVFVDYAHTPAALANVCASLKNLNPKRLITVFGCGGDRDSSKRPLMANAAGEKSDICFITSDNPRSEDPEKIIKEVEAGMVGCPSRSIVDREEAIRTAISVATAGDIVLIAGKGHEDYQIIGDETIMFDDRIKVRAALRELKMNSVEMERSEPKDEGGDRSERGPRPDRGDRPDRGPRPDRGDRPDRGPRPDRGDRPDRGPRPDRGDRR